MTDYYASITVFAISLIYSLVFGGRKTLKWRLLTYGIVTSFYMLSAYITSFSFEGGEFFLVNDPLKYIRRFSWETLSFETCMGYLKKCYFDFADNNALYNVFMNFIGYIYKTYLDGITPYSYSLVSVLFGSLCSITLFRILSNHFPEKNAFIFTLTFSILSLFHFYSVVIIRDIVIAFLYLLCFELILKPFSVFNLLLIIVYFLLTWGVRLYSGLFIILFIFYYLYQAFYQNKARIILIPMLISGVVLLANSSSFVIEQSLDEIELYQNFTENRVEKSGGLVENLVKLPFGVREIALTFFSQVNPFPPYLSFRGAHTFSNFYMSTLVVIYEFWWFTISYLLMYLFLYKKTISSLRMKDIMLLLICLLFIIANTAQPDIRRMMPVYPIFYLYYLKLTNYSYKKSFVKNKRNELITAYFFMIFIYYLLKW